MAISNRLSADWGSPLAASMVPRPIKAPDVIVVKLQGPAIAVLGLVEPALELKDLAQPVVGLCRARRVRDELEHLVPG